MADVAIPTSMTLREPPALREFRMEARAWLEANVPVSHLAPAHTEEGFEARRNWEQRLFEAGWAAVHWPRRYGGRDAGVRESAVFTEEYLRAGAPERINGLGLNLFGPALLEFGTDLQRERWLPSILRCDDIWCQGFSEPDAGSDLAALRTTARIDGDEYVVDGQKIWTSLAGFGDWIFALVRTNPDVPKHRGITMLAIDLRSPGVDIRPLRQLDGDPSFAEVFFDGVRVPSGHVIGEVDDGWRVAMHALGLERGSSFGAHVGCSEDVAALVRLRMLCAADADEADEAGRAAAADLDDRIARAYVRSEAYRAMSQRLLARVEVGHAHPADASMAKLYRTELRHEIFEIGLALLDDLGELAVGSDELLRRFGPDLDDVWREWHHEYWYSRAAKIFAGTNEVQRNIIAERWLNLPKEGDATRTR